MKDEEYRKLLRFCAKHGFICLEYHRRHGIQREVEKKRFAQIGADPKKGRLCNVRW